MNSYLLNKYLQVIQLNKQKKGFNCLRGHFCKHRETVTENVKSILLNLLKELFRCDNAKDYFILNYYQLE